MSTVSGALNKAIVARLRGDEALTGDAEAAQVYLSGLRWRRGTMSKNGVLPSGNFYEDAGVDAMPRAPDVGILTHAIRRFELWTNETDAAFFDDGADALERLFDERRGAPVLPIDGDGRVYEGALFVGMQAPYHDENINAWYGLISFRFVEARP